MAAPSLQGFLDWLAAADDIDIKRDPDAPSAAVRIMTVHGAKGLQAPVVIMADAARTHGEGHSVTHLMAGDPKLPLYGLSTKTLPAMLRADYEAGAAREAQENLRLLYVAMTRAEDYLFAGGLPAGRRGVNSWYDLMRAAMEDLDTEDVETPIWEGKSLRHASGTKAKDMSSADRKVPVDTPSLPVWAGEPAPPEARPPRPLAPSAPDDDSGLPPPGPQLEKAARRGKLIHALFQKLPTLPPGERRGAALRWLASRAEGLDAAQLADEVLTVLNDPAHAALFAKEALPEAPISAIVGERVISGTIDVLLVEADRVRLVDYKTDRQVPDGEADVPDRHQRQMRTYVAALDRIFPGRTIEAGLLYTAGPKLIWLRSI